MLVVMSRDASAGVTVQADSPTRGDAEVRAPDPLQHVGADFRNLAVDRAASWRVPVVPVMARNLFVPQRWDFRTCLACEASVRLDAGSPAGGEISGGGCDRRRVPGVAQPLAVSTTSGGSARGCRMAPGGRAVNCTSVWLIGGCDA